MYQHYTSKTLQNLQNDVQSIEETVVNVIIFAFIKRNQQDDIRYQKQHDELTLIIKPLKVTPDIASSSPARQTINIRTFLLSQARHMKVEW